MGVFVAAIARQLPLTNAVPSGLSCLVTRPEPIALPPVADR